MIHIRQIKQTLMIDCGKSGNMHMSTLLRNEATE